MKNTWCALVCAMSVVAFPKNTESLHCCKVQTETSALELSADIGMGEAAYANRAMDARTFDGESYQ